MSELEAPNLQRSTERWSRGFGRRGQWSIGAPGGAGTDDGCRFGVVSEFGRRLDADQARALLTVWLYVKEQAQTVLPLCAFFGGPSANHGILFTKSVAASWFSCCFRVVHLVMQGKDAD